VTVGRHGAVDDVESDELRRPRGRGQNSRAAHRVVEGQKEESAAHELHCEQCTNQRVSRENVSSTSIYMQLYSTSTCLSCYEREVRRPRARVSGLEELDVSS
jgi:hypothetical protein